MTQGLAESSIESVLVISVSRIGDTLFTTPALRAIATAWPQAAITVLAHPKRAEILEHLPFVHRVGHISKPLARFRGWLPCASFDYAFVYGFDEVLVRYALRRAKRVIAFRQGDASLNRRLYRAVEPAPFQSEHAVAQALRLPAAVGIPPAGLRIAYQETADEIGWARRYLSNTGFADRQPLIGLQVASFPTKAYRDWPIENFAELCRRIVARWPRVGFLIFGGNEEAERTAWLHRQLGSTALLLAGRLTLRQTAALMAETDAYVGVDTGPTHIMSSFDIPLIGLYHCVSSTADTGPLDHPLDYCIDHPRKAINCDAEASMAEITVPMVETHLYKALTEHPPRPRAGEAT